MKKKKRRIEEDKPSSLSQETKRGIVVIVIFTLAIIIILSFLSIAGVAGQYIDFALGMGFGWGRYIVPLILLTIGYLLARPNTYKITWPNYLGLLLFVFSLLGLLHSNINKYESWDLATTGAGGGIAGYYISFFLTSYLGLIATFILLFAFLFTSLLLMFNKGIEYLLEKTNIFKMFQPMFKKQEAIDENAEQSSEETEEPESVAFASKKIGENGEIIDEGKETIVEESKTASGETSKNESTQKIDSEEKLLSKIIAPNVHVDLSLDLLDDRISKPTSGDTKVNADKIKHTLKNFNIDVEMNEIKVGPTVTQYTLKPAEGIKLTRITALNNDLALSLAAHPIRIEAPIPGKSLVGIEVPNQRPAIVRIREVIDSEVFRGRKANMYIALGKDVSGTCWADNLTKMPHLLVAGSTGSGKSVCLNSIILSLLYENNPDTLRFILVDPKRVEFPIYNGIPHLLTPVITDVTKTVNALRWAIAEMDNRFDILAKLNKRDIASYNAVSKEKLPYIVIIIDELADLMIAAAAEVEACIIRLTQMARAVGIHLVVATQRPSVDVITGLIKANIPCRIAFSVASLMDSRTILDSAGAEKLVGKGDMLYMSPSYATCRRLQGTFTSDEEIKRVVNFLKEASNGETIYHEEIVNKKKGGPSSFDFSEDSGDDDMYEEAKKIVIESGKASTSYLQRRLRLGYARAARIIDLLEENGVVGHSEGAKPREILVDRVNSLTAENNINPDFPQSKKFTGEEIIKESIEPEETEEETEEEIEEQEELAAEEPLADEPIDTIPDEDKPIPPPRSGKDDEIY